MGEHVYLNLGVKDRAKHTVCGEYCEFLALTRKISRNHSVIHGNHAPNLVNTHMQKYEK